MEKIICDTNIWYNIAKKEIDEIELNKFLFNQPYNTKSNPE